MQPLFRNKDTRQGRASKLHLDRTRIADTLNDDVRLFRREAFRKINGWYFYLVQAFCFVADFAMKMNVYVLRIVAFTIIETKPILDGSTPIIDAVDYFVDFESLKRSEKGNPIGRFKVSF